MINREQLKQEIDAVDDAYIEVLHRIIVSLKQPPDSLENRNNGEGSNSQTNEPKPHSSLFQKLKTVKISGPEDFSENIDDYLTGERNV